MSKDSEKGRYQSPEGSILWEMIATFSCSLYVFIGGCVPGWNSPSLGILLGPDTPIPFTASDASTLTAMITLGHALSPILTMVMADKLGRKKSILAACLPSIISWGLIAVTDNLIVLSIARLIGGLALGWIYCFPQIYLGEIASAKLRGATAMVCGTMMNAGILFMYTLVPYQTIKTTACVCLTISIAAIISVWFIPESPYYLVMIGKYEDAEASLEKLRGKSDVAEEFEVIKRTINNNNNKFERVNDGQEDEEQQQEPQGGRQEAPRIKETLKKLYTVTGNRRALLINFLFIGVLQLGSYISTMAYGQILFGKIDSGISPHICIIILAALQLLSNILCAFVIDKLGRRPLILISGLASGFCLSSVALYFYLAEHTNVDVSKYGLLATCALLANIAVLNLGLMPLQHVIQSEILATDIKGLATCVIGVGGGVIATIGVKTYLTVAITWGYGQAIPFITFTGVTWIGTAIILKMLPETKGKSLFEIQRDMNK